MFDTIFGLPVHPLVVHATVVIVPAAAGAVALAAASRRFRAWAGFLPLLLSAAAVVLVPISTASGEALEKHVAKSALLKTHTQIAEGLLLPVLVLLVAAAALFWVQRKESAQPADAAHAPAVVPRAALGVIVALSALAVIGTTVQVARIGHSGAKAAWSDVVTQNTGGGEASSK